MARLLGQRAHHEAVVSELGLETNLVLDRRQWQSGDDWSSITCKWVPSERKHYGVHATVPVEQGTCLAPPRAQVRIVPEELRAGPLFTAPVRIVPEELRAGPLFTAPVYQYSWGVQANRAASTAFTVFDHHRHVLVERCAPFASLQDIAALAINDAPFQVIAVKVLADPLPAYPTPQIVLSELGRPLDELPIPWDLRPIGEPVKTVRHLSRQDRQDALLDVQQLLTSPRNFAQEVAVGAIVVTDALGVLQPQLPANLHVVQHYRVAAMPVGEAPVPVAGEVAGPGATTATTTNTQIYAAAPQPPGICLAVLRGAVMHSIDVGARTGLLDAFLLQLLERHHDQSPISMPFQLVLASVQPPRQGYFQEAVVLLNDTMTRAPSACPSSLSWLVFSPHDRDTSRKQLSCLLRGSNQLLHVGMAHMWVVQFWLQLSLRPSGPSCSLSRNGVMLDGALLSMGSMMSM
eukprot:s2698_g5.t1